MPVWYGFVSYLQTKKFNIRLTVKLEWQFFFLVLFTFCLSTPSSVVFTARRYASAVHAVVQCPSVCHKPALYKNG